MQTKKNFLRGELMGALCLLVCVLLAFSYQKLKKIGLNVEYTPTATVGEEVRFLFTAGDNVQRIKIFSDKGSLGTIKTVQNRAELSFAFGFPSTKKLRFVGISSTNDTVSVAYGEIAITGKSLGNVVVIQNEPNNGSASINNEPDISKPIYSLPVTNLRFNPTPFEDPFLGKNQNVYGTAIGHPTQDEARAFLEDIKPIAVELGQKYQIPASVVMAMAAMESGYGYSRNAVFANNFFGIKQWWGNESNAYQLKGQPDEYEGKVAILKRSDDGQIIYDENRRPDNWYRRFSSRRECIEFLVEEVFLHKTGAWKRDYSDIAKFYRGQISAGVEKYSAAYTFIYSVGERGYTHKGGKFYADRIMKVVDRYGLIEVD
jgi:Mannosyl-glycoprotein endo-beta-N-acetylglucosaminidase